jgi:hypothetical protein
MNGAFSVLSLLSVISLIAMGCSGSDDSGGPISNPTLVNGTDSGPAIDAAAMDGGPGTVCNGTDCSAIPMSRLCGRPHTTLIQDGLSPDDTSNAMIQQALVDDCLPVPATASLEKGRAGAIDPTTGRPMAGKDNLLTIAGGNYVQKTVAYLDTIAATQVYLVTKQDGSWQYVSRAGTVVAELSSTTFSPTHDILLIELVRDPLSETPVLIAFGQEAESTRAAAWYVAHQILPHASSYDKSWYAFEWTASPTGADDASNYLLKGMGP